MDPDSIENKSYQQSTTNKQTTIKQSITNATKIIYIQIQQFVQKVDQQLLLFEKFIQKNYFYTNIKSQNPQKQNLFQGEKIISKQKTKVSIIINYLIKSVTQQVSKQFLKFTQKIIPQNFNTIKTLYSKVNQQLIQLEKFHSQFLTSILQSMKKINQPELNSDKTKQQEKIKQIKQFLKFDQLLLKYGIKYDPQKIWQSKQNFEKHFINMQLLEHNKIKSIDMKLLKQKQNQLLKEISLLRNQTKETSQKSIIKEKERNHQLRQYQSQTNLKLKQLYQSLFQINRHFIVLQTIAWPQINSYYVKKNIKQNCQLLDKRSNLIKHKVIEFKLQAQGFTVSNNENPQNSIKSKISKTINQTETLTQFQQDILKHFQQLQLTEENKFFQFGLINQLQSQHITNIQVLNKISIKIINIQGKFFIQSLNQAKLIQLNPLWEYFGIQILQEQQNDQLFLFFYGLVNKTESQNQKNTQKQQKPKQQAKPSYQKQSFLKIPFPPTLKNKVSKSFFLFKGFQCKITIKND